MFFPITFYANIKRRPKNLIFFKKNLTYFNTFYFVSARVVMTERNDSGPIRPCHLREVYRRLKLEGKIPRKSVPRLFR